MNTHRGLFLSAAAITATAFTVGLAPAALATGPGSNKPPGNNGTVKIDEYTMDAGHDNDPHVKCGFSVNFFGYDGGPQQATIDIRPVAPTAGSGSFATSTSWDVGTRTSGGQFDRTVPISFSDLRSALSGVSPQAQQGYHLRLEVEVTGSQGSDDKYKTFWLQPCAGTASSSSNSSSTTSSTSSTTSTTVASGGSQTTSGGTTGPSGGTTTAPSGATTASSGPTRSAAVPVASAAESTGPAGSPSNGSALVDALTGAAPAGPAGLSGSPRLPVAEARTSGTAGSGSLAFTGADIAGVGLAGISLIGAGALIAARARRRETDPA
jgi:hypothetical protein